jgi:hypothetical protein
MVTVPPRIAANPIGIISRDRGIPVFFPILLVAGKKKGCSPDILYHRGEKTHRHRDGCDYLPLACACRSDDDSGETGGNPGPLDTIPEDHHGCHCNHGIRSESRDRFLRRYQTEPCKSKAGKDRDQIDTYPVADDKNKGYRKNDSEEDDAAVHELTTQMCRKKKKKIA